MTKRKSAWCKRCGEYDVWGKGCQCTFIGRVWRTEDGEDESHDVWSPSYTRPEEAVRKWVQRRHYEDHEFMPLDEAVAFSFRPAAGGQVEYFTVLCELAPSFHSEAVDKDDDTVQEARRYFARSLRARRARVAKTVESATPVSDTGGADA